ncbi:MAG: Re/Si-specific NAD(P)(+) transhydrogenase subunit alpha [bacterium JZ-2024 1]
MKVGVLREKAPHETRVALTPDSILGLKKMGAEVFLESGAGSRSYYPDASYEKAGAQIVSSAADIFRDADVIIRVNRPTAEEAEQLRSGRVWISFFPLAGNADLIWQLAQKKVSVFFMEGIPRISRAQSMDALTSQANIAGYKAVLIAASTLPRFFPMLVTAAGTIFPAKVLVLGAGVAGLQAIATARRLGAVVWGYDIRPAVKEQVESLGARFLEFKLQGRDLETAGGYARELTPDERRAQQEWLAQKITEFDVVITAAQVPGKRAPILITKQTVERMNPGSVIVDLAAENGGNCEVTKPGESVVHAGVLIHGPLNLSATMPVHASQMYSRNVTDLLKLLIKDGRFQFDFGDEVVREACLTHNGEIVSAMAKAILGVEAKV